MDNSIRSIKPEEQKYLYAQSQQLKMQCGAIGYLRGDFSSDGNGFFTTWFDQNNRLNTDEFKSEIDEVINDMRTEVLKSRSAMSKYCDEHSDSSFEGAYCTEYGFRRDTEKYAYLLRCNPTAGDYNFYCWCFVKEWLDRNIEKASGGIRFIDSSYNEKFRIPDGDWIAVTSSWDETNKYVCRYIDDYHVEIGTGLYHICEFAERMEKNGVSVIPLRSSLPDKCFSVLPSSNELIIIERGIKGYTPSNLRIEGKTAQETADNANALTGITKAQEAAMLAGSMFGFDVPAADPKNYNDDGIPICNNQKKAGISREELEGLAKENPELLKALSAENDRLTKSARKKDRGDAR